MPNYNTMGELRSALCTTRIVPRRFIVFVFAVFLWVWLYLCDIFSHIPQLYWLKTIEMMRVLYVWSCAIEINA